MKRAIAGIELEEGTWLGLECGHPYPTLGYVEELVDCVRCDRRQVPLTARLGRATPVFDASSVPPALLGSHQTSAWAELVVLEGWVEFYDDEPPWHATATPERRVVIVPNRLHHIEPSAQARFLVQFHDQPQVAKAQLVQAAT